MDDNCIQGVTHSVAIFSVPAQGHTLPPNAPQALHGEPGTEIKYF